MVLFTDENYLKNYTPISQNLKWTVPLESALREAQIKYIRPALCTDLYDELELQIANNTLTPANQALLDNYLRPALAYFTVYTLVPMAVFKLRDAGLVQQAGGNNFNQTSAIKDIEYFRNFALESANNYLILTKDKIKDICQCDQPARVYQKYILPL